MAVLERVATLVRANLNDLIDRAEDPEKMIKQVILDMENQLLQVKTQVAVAMITGAHFLFYSANAEADRVFFKDVLGLASVDAGRGWLIFALPPTEAAVHPASTPFVLDQEGEALLGAVLYLIDTLSFTLAVGVLLVVGLIAGLVPARRATKVSPIVALRAE